ncbi:MAG: OmcA/MtrC family decaheme c-type cytochrome [Thermodesulfobacteriota bacterium]
MNDHRHAARNFDARSFVPGMLVALLAASLVLTASCGNGGDGDGPSPTPTPMPTAMPSPGGMAGAGVEAELTGASVAEDGTVEVTFTLTDARGVPLTATLSSAETDQQARVRLAIARAERYSGGGDLANEFVRYVNETDETRPAYDRDGTLDLLDAEAGLYRYRFGTNVGFVEGRTYSIGMQVDREFDGVEEWANPVLDFVVGGGEPLVREDTTTAQCNTCHQPLIAHGNRREVRLCTLCHTEAGVDELGRSIDFRNMIHKIHAGTALPSVADGPPGATYAIFSAFADEDVVFAEKQEDGTVTGVTFPRPLQSCSTCHAEGPTAEFWRTKPSTPACATCHDDVNPSMQTTQAGPPGTNHPPGGYLDGQCNACHRADEASEFDISVPGAHVIPEQSSMLAGLQVMVLGVSDTAPGQMPRIDFRVTDGAGNPLRDLSGLNRLGFTLAGPTTDYAELFTFTAVGGGASGELVGPDAEGDFQYVAPAPIPDGATGSWAVGAEARRPVQLTESTSVNEAAPNPVTAFSVEGGEPEPRRRVVDDQLCWTCHGEFSKGFSVHGNLRNRVEYCVLCHNPNESDAARRRNDPEAVASGSPTATIDFKVLIHKIHRGEELAMPYVVYGFGPSPPGFSVHDFNEVLYPGDLRDCATCHVDDSQLLPPFPGTALGTLMTHLDPSTGDEVVDGRIGPITAACTSCHDSEAAIAHAQNETAPGGAEACAVCHGEGRDVAVSVAHEERN